jgi:hypothetical protein
MWLVGWLAGWLIWLSRPGLGASFATDTMAAVGHVIGIEARSLHNSLVNKSGYCCNGVGITASDVVHAHSHTRTRTHTHTCTRAHMHTHVRTRTYAHMLCIHSGGSVAYLIYVRHLQRVLTRCAALVPSWVATAWFGRPQAYAPNMNLAKDPRWGRSQEVYSEDPHLSSEMTVSFVAGMQAREPLDNDLAVRLGSVTYTRQPALSLIIMTSHLPHPFIPWEVLIRTSCLIC